MLVSLNLSGLHQTMKSPTLMIGCMTCLIMVLDDILILEAIQHYQEIWEDILIRGEALMASDTS